LKVTIFLEHRFQQTPDGEYWAKNSFSYSFWKPYLEVFSQVNIVARVLSVDHPSEGYSISSGDNVSFSPIAYYKGPIQFLLKYQKIKRQVNEALINSHQVILRVPTSGLSDLAFKVLHRENKDYSVEVVADPFDVLSKGSIDSVFRRFYQKILTNSLKQLCEKAKFASYVTEYSLQNRYPATEAKFATWYSDVKIAENEIAPEPRSESHFSSKKQFVIISVGTMSHVLYKAQDVLIKALVIVLKTVPHCKLQLVGDGENIENLKELAKELNVSDNVEFLGYVKSGEDVFRLLDKADLFVLPSRQEGLPRAMLEAFARALPCIGSTVGGFPELLNSEYMVTPNDEKSLGQLMINVLSDPKKLSNMSANNLLKSTKYSSSVFRKTRMDFYKRIAQG